MAIDAFQVVALHNSLFFNTGSSNSRGSGAYASEFPMLPDNVNNSGTRYVRMAGVFASGQIASSQYASPGNQGSYLLRNGDTFGYPFRPFGSFYTRTLIYTIPADGANNFRSGYIGSFVGGMGGGNGQSGDNETCYVHDPNGTSVDFEPIYGHGAAVFPQGAGFTNQFRDSTSLPADGTAVVTKSSTAQTWARSMYAPPIFYTLWNSNVGGTAQTIGSGSVGFYIETKPSLQIAGTGSHCPFGSDGASVAGSQSGVGNGGSVFQPSNPQTSYNTPPVANTFYPFEQFNATGTRKLNSRSMSLLFARIFDNSNNSYGWRHEEDGSDPTGGNFGVNTTQITTQYPWQRINDEFRVRNASMFPINEEYYGFVMDTKCMIFSNKASMLPLLFFDLVDTWGSTKPRIAGVAVKTTSTIPATNNPWQGHIYFLSENGALVDYDFTTLGGTPTLIGLGGTTHGFPVPAVNEGYSSLTLSSDGLTLYALYGTQKNDPRTTSTGVTAPRVALYPYTISTQLVGSINVATVQGRINGRHLREATLLRDGRVAILCEDTTSGADTNNTLGSTNIAWQLMVFDPSAGTQWNASKINAGTPLSSSTFTNMQLTGDILTIAAVNTFSVGDVVTLGGITSSFYSTFNGMSLTVKTGSSGSTLIFNTPVHGDIGPVASPGGTAVRGLQYGQDFSSFWYYNPNAHMHHVGPNTVLVQGSWNGSNLFTVVLNAAGSTPVASSVTAVGSNSPVTVGGTNYSPSILPADIGFINNYGGNNGTSPLDIRHQSDFSTVGDRTFIWANDRAPIRPSDAGGTSNSSVMRMYYCQNSFNFNGTQQATYLERNTTDGNGYITQHNAPLAQGGASDHWYAGDLGNHDNTGSFSHNAWAFPLTVFTNNINFVIAPSSLGDDGPGSPVIYGRRILSQICYLPTYWKWSGSAWVIADNSLDAKNFPHPVPSTPGTDVNIIDGLIVNFGNSTSSSFGPSEFYNFNLCYGNTKMFRNVRFPYAAFAGQTFLQTDTRTMATQQAIAIQLVDTDICTIATPTVPVDPSAAPTTVTPGTLGWTTKMTWPKLNGSTQPYNGPLVVVLTANSFDPTTAIIAPNNNSSNTWTVGSDTFTASASATQGGYNPFDAFYGSPNVFWRGQNVTDWIEIDLGTGPAAAKVPLAYSYRPYWDGNGSDGTASNNPTNFVLEYSDNNSTWTTADSRTGISVKRGQAFSFSSVGAHRYWRLRTVNTFGGGAAALGFFQLYTAAPANSMSFSDLVFFNYSDNVGGDGQYLRQNGFARGLKFEVSTNGGSSYTQILPLWRASTGVAFCFNRQTGVTNLRITCQSGYNYGTSNGGASNDIVHNAFGPFYLIDWMTGAGQTTLNNARLGSSGASDGTPARGSWDTNILGTACDNYTIQIDALSPNTLLPQQAAIGQTNNGFIQTYSAIQVWDFFPVANNGYKAHPFWGFILFAGAGQANAFSTTYDGVHNGTSLSIEYNWGRRI